MHDVKKFSKFVLSVSLFVASASSAFAAEFRKFDPSAFAAAQAQGRPILVDVKAWWCPVCASQGRTIKRVANSAQYNNLIVFNVNYDKQKNVLRDLAVTKQATLIAFRGSRQTGRLDFVTDKARIEALIASTLN
jgi:thioredoxin 1